MEKRKEKLKSHSFFSLSGITSKLARALHGLSQPLALVPKYLRKKGCLERVIISVTVFQGQKLTAVTHNHEHWPLIISLVRSKVPVWGHVPGYRTDFRDAYHRFCLSSDKSSGSNIFYSSFSFSCPLHYFIWPNIFIRCHVFTQITKIKNESGNNINKAT